MHISSLVHQSRVKTSQRSSENYLIRVRLCLECSVYLTGASDRWHKLLEWVRTDQSLRCNNEAGGILYTTWWECFNYNWCSQVRVLIFYLVVCGSKYLMKVFDLLNRVSQPWWNWKGTSYSRISILTKGILLWLTFFSPCHSSNQIRREVRPSLKLHKMLFRISTLCEISGPLTVWCWLLLSVRSKMSDQSQLWSLHFQPSFQHLNRGRSRTQRGDVLDSIEDDGDGFFPGQRHDIVSAILAQCALYQQSLDPADIAARDSWAHLSRWRDNAPDWKNEIC